MSLDTRPGRTVEKPSGGSQTAGTCVGVGCLTIFTALALVMAIVFLTTFQGAARLAALIPLLFVVGGLALIRAVISGVSVSPERMLAQRGEGGPKDLPLPPVTTYFGRMLPVRLAPEQSVRAGLCGVLLAAVFWNGIVGGVAYAMAASGESGWVWLLLAPFMAVGALLVIALIKTILVSARVAPTIIELQREPLTPGERVQVRIRQKGPLSLENLTVDLVCQEKATYTRGTDTFTDTREIWRDRLLETGPVEIRGASPFEENVEARIPETAMHSFKALKNEIQWALEVKGAVRRWPDFHTRFPLRVIPRGVKERLEWARESISG